MTGGAATLDEVLANVADQGIGIHCAKTDTNTKLQLVPDLKGASTYLEIVGGSALTGLGLSVATHVDPGSSNVADADHVTLAELDTLLKAATTNKIGVTAPAGYAVFTHAQAGGAHSIQFVNGGANDAASIAALGIPDTSVHSGTSSSPVDTQIGRAHV